MDTKQSVTSRRNTGVDLSLGERIDWGSLQSRAGGTAAFKTVTMKPDERRRRPLPSKTFDKLRRTEFSRKYSRRVKYLWAVE